MTDISDTIVEDSKSALNNSSASSKFHKDQISISNETSQNIIADKIETLNKIDTNKDTNETEQSVFKDKTNKSIKEPRVDIEMEGDDKQIDIIGKRFDAVNEKGQNFRLSAGLLKKANNVKVDEKSELDFKLEHYFDNLDLNMLTIDESNKKEVENDVKMNKEFKTIRHVHNKNVEENGKEKPSEIKVEINASNILDTNALAMYQKTMNQRNKTKENDISGCATIEKIGSIIDGVKGDDLNGAKQKVEKKKPFDSVLVRKMSSHGLVGVVPAGQKAKKVQNKKFGTIAKHFTKLPEKVLYARNTRGVLLGSRLPVAGGVPIDEELAMELRTVAFGSSGCPPRGEWIRTPLTIRPANQPLAYGLTAPRNGCRGLLTALGAHVLKHLLFGSERPRDVQGKYLQTDLLLRPDEFRQQEALIYAIAEVIWRACGDTKKAFVVIPQDVVYVQHSHTYYQDTITEKLHIFEFHNLEDVQIFVKRYLYLFDEEPGCGTILLLYSCMLSRGLENIKKDLDGNFSYLVSSQVEGSINVVMLLLTGRATPYLHNGVIYVGDEDHYALPQYGVLARSSIGLLEWRGSDDHQDSERQPPGSRLKTPALPIWVTFCAGHYGMLFNTNRELLRNYHAERRFDLQYYTCGGCYVFLSVDTRALNDGSKDDINATPLEKLIHTKWQDAKITWTGQTPYVGEMIAN